MFLILVPNYSVVMAAGKHTLIPTFHCLTKLVTYHSQYNAGIICTGLIQNGNQLY